MRKKILFVINTFSRAGAETALAGPDWLPSDLSFRLNMFMRMMTNTTIRARRIAVYISSFDLSTINFVDDIICSPCYLFIHFIQGR